MIYQITKGIKISVVTNNKGVSFKDKTPFYVYSYAITIENNSSDTVKLTDRFWQIYDSLSATEIVSGEGVVGQTPVLAPNDSYTYTSGCFLASNIGAMKGFYTMINLDTFEQFKVVIPNFQLITPYLLN
ncbi:Co2+/Mg2+ efflux protein ApaG [uncultured Polaribacter sp.]|uniref:Co2+/Mg2+ efflux protein ApaG n=1 Tax=uncultured Polaribacter sp. TaxID=174711 RepID=UPI00263798B3|nr:Co2+/Mg2+ efflux protein ApaG [uncultured Polaribacter sp.]